jgi:hypothetical protein
MRPRDTSPEVQALMDEHYRRMSPAERGETLRRSWRTARALQLAGMRSRFPDEDEEQLELRLAEVWLGSELFERVRVWLATRSKGSHE